MWRARSFIFLLLFSFPWILILFLLYTLFFLIWRTTCILRGLTTFVGVVNIFFQFVIVPSIWLSCLFLLKKGFLLLLFYCFMISSGILFFLYIFLIYYMFFDSCTVSHNSDDLNLFHNLFLVHNLEALIFLDIFLLIDICIVSNLLKSKTCCNYF